MKQQPLVRDFQRLQLYDMLLFVLLTSGLTLMIVLKHVWRISTKVNFVTLLIIVIFGNISLFLSKWMKTKMINRVDGALRFNYQLETNFDDKVLQLPGSGNAQTLHQLRMAEEQLKEAYLEINGILESINDGFLATDNEWRITYINTKAASILFPRKKITVIGEVIWDVVPELADTIVYPQIQRAIRDHIPVHFEMVNEADGKWFSIHAYPGAKGVSVLFREITKHKNDEIALEQSRQQIYDIIEGISDSFYALDSNFRYRYMNQMNEKFLKGKKRDEMIGCKLWDIYPEAEGTLFHQQLLRTMNEKKPILYEDYFSYHDRWLENRIYPAKDGVLVFCSDITERKKAEKALEAERELLVTVLAAIEEGVIATDTDGKIILMSRSAEKMTGWTIAEVKGELLEQCFYVIHDKTSEPYIGLVEKTLDSKEPISLNNVVLISKALREVKIGLYCAPLHHDTDQQALGAVVVFEDITEKQRIEQELLKTEKLESLGILAGGIAHDFNNYLAAILSNIQLAKIMLAKGKNVDKNLDQAIDVSMKASGLTRQLLTFTKGGTPVKKLGSIRQLIEDTVQFNLRGSKIKCVFSLPGNLWNAEFDHDQISQVISNLVVNAKHAMPRGGILSVRAENVILDNSSAYRQGKYLKVVIKDQGTGISETIITKIFDPFFTTKPDGNGLGLATSYSIISKHGGYIDISSIPEQGCKCTFYLPASDELLLDPVKTDSQLPGIMHGSILLMDDESMIRTVMEESLTFIGFKVVTTKDGEETIERYRQNLLQDAPFDIVILDLTIPGGMGGLETLAQLREMNPNVKAVVSSGYANDPVSDEFQNFGFAAFASKPYKLNELTEILLRLMNNDPKNVP